MPVTEPIAQQTPLDTLVSRLEVVRAENARLFALLGSRGIEWRGCWGTQPQVQTPFSSDLSTTWESV